MYPSPSFILRDDSPLELGRDQVEDGARVVGKVQVAHLGALHRDDGEGLLVLLDRGTTDLSGHCLVSYL